MTTCERILISGPSITEKEVDYVSQAVKNAWFENANFFNDKFEKAFATYVGRSYAISLPSCTSAIHLALLAIGVGVGDEVIVPDITWIATAAPVSYVGATPVFADIDAKTWCLSAESLENCITSRTKAVIVVDLYGNMPNMSEIRDIANKYNIHMIEDAAEAIGSEFKGKKAGSFGEISTFSFHGSKTMTTGEGGMLVTDSQEIYERVLTLRDHGRILGKKLFWNNEVAYKYKMSSMQAALGLAQLERIEELIFKKREIFTWYGDELKYLDVISLNYESKDTKNTYWMVTAILDPSLGAIKEDLGSVLVQNNIDFRPFFYPLSSLPAYANLETAIEARQRNIQSYAISPYGVNLPCGMQMTKQSVTYVCGVLKDFVTGLMHS